MNFNEFLEKEALSFKDKVIFNKEVLFQDENQSQHLLSLQKYLEKTFTKTRVDAGKEKLKIWENQLKKIHAFYLPNQALFRLNNSQSFN